MFVSNSDNLGATLDLKLLTYFAQSGRAKASKVAGSGRDVQRVKTIIIQQKASQKE